MAVPSTIDVASPIPIVSPARVSLRNSATETSAAVAPPMPLNSATICGIAVICTVLPK